MADEIHCYATIYCKKQHADDVKKALKDLDLYVTRGSVFVTDKYVEFAATYMDTDDAEYLINMLGDKVDDFDFSFEDYDYGGHWRYTKQSGIEGEKTYYPSDAAKRLRSIGYAQAEISKILSTIG